MRLRELKKNGANSSIRGEFEYYDFVNRQVYTMLWHYERSSQAFHLADIIKALVEQYHITYEPEKAEC